MDYNDIRFEDVADFEIFWQDTVGTWMRKVPLYRQYLVNSTEFCYVNAYCDEVGYTFIGNSCPVSTIKKGVEV